VQGEAEKRRLLPLVPGRRRSYHRQHAWQRKASRDGGGVVALVVLLIATVVAVKDRILEEYWLSKLKHGDEAEKRVAAQKLGESASVKAVPLLVQESAPDYAALSIESGNILFLAQRRSRVPARNYSNRRRRCPYTAGGCRQRRSTHNRLRSRWQSAFAGGYSVWVSMFGAGDTLEEAFSACAI